MPEKILIVDDEPMLVSLLSDYLSDLGYFTCTAADGKEALDKLRFSPDLILLDINMPGMNGLELCRMIRDEVSCPILFLTSRASEQDRINGLLLGGEHLRREARSRNSSRLLASRELLVNLSNRTVHYKGEKIDFSRREFDIIEFLITHAGQVFDRERIYEGVWGLDAAGDSAVIKEHISKIRQKLQKTTGRDYIETVWGVGYKWKQ